MPPSDLPHRRYNPLLRQWVLVSPHRARRPWLGQMERTPPENLPEYDPRCYLCPGNERAGGKRNPVYQGCYVFDNDFPAVLTARNGVVQGASGQYSPPAERLFRYEAVSGICRVVGFSPRHDLSLPRLPLPEIEMVVRTWADQTQELGSREEIQYVQVFENKGEMMGASNPHPHSQIWSTSFIPNDPANELAAQQDYMAEQGSCLLCDYLMAERGQGERIVVSNDHFTAFAPYWAIWPFELLVIAHRHTGSLTDLSPVEVSGLADILHQVTVRYDNLFEVSFPYSMGFHQSPTDGIHRPEAHLHLHFYPPLLRSATVRKFMVGFELLAMPQRDLTPETAAERLRLVSGIHYIR